MSFAPRDASVGTIKRGGKLPVLLIGGIGLGVSSNTAPLGLKAICGPLFFESAFWPT